MKYQVEEYVKFSISSKSSSVFKNTSQWFLVIKFCLKTQIKGKFFQVLQSKFMTQNTIPK